MHHRQKVMKWDMDLFPSLAINTELGSGAHDHGAIVIGATLALFRLPDKVALVSNEASGDSGTVVATPAHEHHADFRNLTVDLKVIKSLLGNSYVIAVGILGNVCSTVGVLGLDGVLSVLNIGGVDNEEMLRSGIIHIKPVRLADAVFRVRSHNNWLVGLAMA